ncbi:MAG: bifunctional folylpolyglutamate synthase/dihydrofolate synthase [Bacteroidota bacterium]
MTYRQCLEYLYSQLPMFHRIGPAAYKANLDNTIHIMQMLGNPERGFRCIHVAGTNGKGSTSHMLASILQEAGYKTGLFTSPHLKDFRERIRINGKIISRNKVASFVERYRDGFESIQPSFFEWTAGLAFDHFRNAKVDIAVIETGLGGRLDSTNVVQPLLSLITNVQWDHMNLLGNTLGKISKEKAGIIKQNTPVIIGTSQGETENVFRAVAKKQKASIQFADQVYRIKSYGESRAGEITTFDLLRNKKNILKGLKCGLAGFYQKHNIPLVLAAIELLNEQGIRVSEKALRQGLKNVKTNTGIRGRWEVISKKPITIADTAHNKDGITAVVKQLKRIKHKNLHLVLGAVNDKDISSMLALFPKNGTCYFCKPNIPRGLDALELKQVAEKIGLRGEAYASVKNALRAANKNAHQKDLIYVGGSTFVVAEAL